MTRQLGRLIVNVGMLLAMTRRAAPPVLAGAQPQTGAAAPDVAKLGPQVGDKVPDFGLPDQHGTHQTLASLMGPKGLILVFNRSADW